jgi:hypothetical protein
VSDLDELRRLHQEWVLPNGRECRTCGISGSPQAHYRINGQWPCDTAVLLDRLAATSDPAPLDAARLREFAEDVVRQFGYWSESAAGYTAGGLSTLEEAFAILGWDDPHPVEADDPNRCDERKCRRQSSTGWPTRPGGTGLNGGYRRTCHEHSDFHQQRLCNYAPDDPHFADLRDTTGREPQP